jgi:hypothetical protein
MRALASVCLVLVGFVGIAQAVHIHGDWLPHHSAQLEKAAPSGELPGGEEKCPLCVAMHSALPSSARVALVAMTLVEVRMILVTDRLPNGQWHYARFSRPPPALNS